MKIAIDLQACQTEGSRLRGIGRYSMQLTQALIRRRRSHAVHVLVNDALGSMAEVREQLSGSGAFTFEPFHLAHGVPESSDSDQVNDHILNWRYACSTADVVHVASMFEGWQLRNAHVSARMADVPASVRSATLYDLIPLVFDDVYLPGVTRRQYLARLGALHQLDVIFAISEATRRDAITLLDLPPERVVNIGAATSGAFFPLDNRLARPPERSAKAGLPSRYLLYVGGIDFRKNIDFLLRSYAALSTPMREAVRLVIVCDLSPEKHREFVGRAHALGVGSHVLFTGYVPDEELNELYNGCELFVFPSLYEGFGLPLLEAMTCGAPVIAANTSSMPEIVGRADALFDPHDEGALTGLLQDLLQDAPRRRALAEASLHRSRDYSWDRVADTMLDALEAAAERVHRVPRPPSTPRRCVALFAPLPPAPTHVADYARLMIPFWSRHFDLELVVAQQGEVNDIVGAYSTMDAGRFEDEAPRFDSILYHFGNSSFHTEMYRLLPRFPGIVVMHDFFLSGLVQAFETGQPAAHGTFIREVIGAHGDAAEDFALDASRDDLALRYPVSRRVVEHARGLIFHSRYAMGLFHHFYPDLAGIPACVVPQPCVQSVRDGQRDEKRRRLGLQEEDVLVCAFGVVGQANESGHLREALAHLAASDDARTQVLFVSEPRSAAQLDRDRMLQSHPLRQRITFARSVSDDDYIGYLAACDVGVDLRPHSRGGTSAGLLQQLAAGCATIVIDQASMMELPDDIAIKVPPEDAPALVAAVAALVGNPALRARLGDAARAWVATECHPVKVAEHYSRAIGMLEAQDRCRSAQTIIQQIGRVASRGRLQPDVLASAADAVAAGIEVHRASARWLQPVRAPLD